MESSDQSTTDNILFACKKGSEEGFARLVEMYATRCYGYFYRLTGSRQESDDLLSELFVKVVSKLNNYKGGTFELWLFKMASNVLYDHLRHLQREKKLHHGYRRMLEENAPVKRADDEIFDRLQEKLNQLDMETRELILMRFYSGLSFREIAQLRAEPIGTILSKVHRGLAKLRGLMGSQL